MTLEPPRLDIEQNRATKAGTVGKPAPVAAVWPGTAAGAARTRRFAHDAAGADGQAVLVLAPPGDVLAHRLQRLRKSGDDDHGVLAGLHQKGSIIRLAAQASH